MTAPGPSAGQFDYGHPGAQPGQVPTQSGPPDPTTNPGRPPKRARGGVSWVVYLGTVVVLLLAVFVITFVAENQYHATVWWFGSRHNMSVARALSTAAIGGFVVGLLVGLLASVRVRGKLRALRRGSER
jgi:uncharacterized integral membrane protein